MTIEDQNRIYQKGYSDALHSLKQQLATARREGWEQAKREADNLLLDLVDVVLESKPVVQSARKAIAAMEYGGEK